jgi:NAD/NADP transhydrogenase alpha subunit
MLAGFTGFELIRRRRPSCTQLMSLTNALDAIAVVGATRSENQASMCPLQSTPSPDAGPVI